MLQKSDQVQNSEIRVGIIQPIEVHINEFYQSNVRNCGICRIDACSAPKTLFCSASNQILKNLTII